MTTIQKILLWAGGVVIGLCVLLLIAAIAIGPRLSQIARERLVSTLEERFNSDVSLQSMMVTLAPTITARGEGLTLRKKDASDLPPLIEIRRFTARTSIIRLFARHVSEVTLEGLTIHVPPRGQKSPEQRKPQSGEKSSGSFLIEQLIADGTTLITLPKEIWKEPLQWDIRKLHMQDVAADTSMPFLAVLTNAKPPGEIVSNGHFGPWDKDEPGNTPVSGTYTFRNADLSVFKGISGILSSDGKYDGILQEIIADGQCDVPDFMVQLNGNPIHLVTQYHAIIDGTDGSTQLRPVTAQFGHSELTANGSVEGKKGVKGKTVSLDAVVTKGRLEDMLRLAINSKEPRMKGAIAFRAQIVIPPGHEPVPMKMNLDGAFNVADAKFSKLNVQEKLNDISHRGQGEPNEPDTESVASNFKGKFKLRSGLLTLTQVSFDVPGINVSLNGTYVIESHQLDLHGKARMIAKVSQTTTGFKSFLLKAVDPFLKKKGAGAEIPFKVTGEASDPSFGLDLLHGNGGED